MHLVIVPSLYGSIWKLDPVSSLTNCFDLMLDFSPLDQPFSVHVVIIFDLLLSSVIVWEKFLMIRKRACFFKFIKNLSNVFFFQFIIIMLMMSHDMIEARQASDECIYKKLN